MSSASNKITFLVGAGLVVDAGLPTAITLTNMFRAYLRDEDAPDLEERHACLRVYNLLVGGIRFQEGALNRDPDAHVNIERLATAAIYLQKRAESPLAPYASGWHQQLNEIEGRDPSVLGRFLDVMFDRLRDWLTPTDTSKVTYLARFSDFVSEWNTDIFSLNYDLCIEKALSSVARREFRNGFTTSGWNPETLNDDTQLRLVKLHGSLDWVDDRAFGICSLESPRCDQAEELDDARPLLIFGTDNKLTGRDPFLTLLYLLSSRLNVSDLLITIGYSFGDEYLNQIVAQRLTSNNRLRVVVVSPNAQSLIDGVKFLAKSPRVTAVNHGAKVALQDAVLLQEVRRLLEVVNDESPFGD